MKKQFTSFIILFAIILGFFNVAYKVLPAARASPVEGVISQDTLWTLVDSPFVVTNNITVNAGVTLTIEPGVEVRFGGDFSLIILGKILAQGTADKTIRFTTNDLAGQNDWRSISIFGMQSSFIYCIIEHATNGIVIENGSVDINNCELTLNGESAIQISGGNTVTITNNFIHSNWNGLTLSNNLTGTVQVQNNLISNNIQAGIALEADSFTNTQIVQNRITANAYGFLVQSIVTTHITQNYIYANTVGVYYAGTGYQQIDFNDIYENGIGVDLETGSDSSVDAIHNYWGNRTGPNHEWLNPNGKGNPVGGDGVNLEFIPFLAHSFTYSNIAPIAHPWTDVVTAAVGQTVTFVGTDSQDDGSIVNYYFDFDDTGHSGWTTLSLYNHTYYTTGTFLASLVVEDDVGVWSAPAPTTINVVNFTPLQTLVTANDSTIDSNGQTWVTVYVSDGTTGLANANVELFSVGGGNFDAQSGLTDSNGYFAAKFIAPNVTETIDARIIARASTSGHADGTDHAYVRVLSPLRIEVSPEAPMLKSEDKITLNILVKADFEPVANASVDISSDYGTITPTAGIADSNGAFTFTYEAPVTLNQVNATITIRASGGEHADGLLQVYVVDARPRLEMQIIPDAVATYSGGQMNITVNVEYSDNPIENAKVTASSMNGSFAPAFVLTDKSGNATFVFTAPDVNQETNVAISVNAVKEGYIESTAEHEIAVKPRTFSISVNPSTVQSGRTENITIRITCKEDLTPTEAALVTVSFENGEQFTNVTDSDGMCTFLVKVPETSDHTINLTVTATKIGYEEREVDIALNVVPVEGGFPWLLMLIIVIPIVVILLVAVLVKKKVIVVSTAEENSSEVS